MIPAKYQSGFAVPTNKYSCRWNFFSYMQVEFDTPVGYEEPKRITKHSEDDDAEANEDLQNHYDTNTFVAFSGEGNRLDGKKKKCDKPETATVARVRQLHDYNPLTRK